MPLKIVRPRNSRTKNLYIRGTYLGVEVDESSRTDRGHVARIVLKRIEGEIERGEYRKRPEQQSERDPAPPTFLDAATSYLEAGKAPRHIAALIKYFGETPAHEIDQAAIDKAAMTLHPNVSNATRNSSVYTPVSAILKRAGIDFKIKRPPGAKGRVINDWLPQADAFGIIKAAETFDQEFATLLAFLLYTGPRIGGSLNLQRTDVNIQERSAWARPQKGQPHNAVLLNEDICERLGILLASHDRDRVFRFHYGGHLKYLLVRAKLAYLGIACPERRPVGWREPPNRLKWVTFHIWRHTWATWMRKYGGATTEDLSDSGNWRDKRSAARYVHAVPDGIWDRVAKLPTMKKGGAS
jgi:integrase